ncbi:unnamed protein product, partial [Clonostachys rhizophaga]
MWEPAEATSIWVEIITRRKIELQAQLEEEGELDNEVLLAAGSDYIRSDIYDWDASARAWLRAADVVMGRQQIQLRLIVDNLDIAVNMKPDTYASHRSLGLRNDPNGESADGRSSSDMLHLSSKDQKINQEDPLMKGRGILTLGLEPSPKRDQDCKSVYWALPLAHLRYYGLPVTRMRTSRMSDQDRLTVDEMLWAMLSAYILQWDNGSAATGELLQYFSDVSIELHWAIGCYPASFVPFQGIFRIQTFLETARRVEDKIELLREVASSIAGQSSSIDNEYEFLIIYKKEYFDPEARVFSSAYEYATACPDYAVVNDGLKIDGPRQHRRWISPHESDQMLTARLGQIRSDGEMAEVIGPSLYPVFQCVANRRARKSEKDVKVPHSSHGRLKLYSIEPDLAAQFGPKGTCSKPDQPIIHQEHESLKDTKSHAPKYQLKTATIMKFFRPEKVRFEALWRMLKLNTPEHDVILGMTLVDSLYKTLPNATVDVRVIQLGFEKAHWIRSMLSPQPAAFTSRRTFASYRLPRYGSHHLTSSVCFACIAMMETGSYNLCPEDLENVFALSSADSLYISSAVLQDPATNTSSAPIQRLAGNIGRAGVAFLVPPVDPETKSYDSIDEWYCLDHKEFDGVVDDCFQGTSLHLSFSEACQPLNVQFSGNRDVGAYFIEALVSVYDRGKWVSELDILGSLRNRRILRDYLHSDPCQCSPVQPLGARIISIDNYAEMVVPPKAPGIVRAKGNWQARLVAAAICIAKGYRGKLDDQDGLAY